MKVSIKAARVNANLTQEQAGRVIHASKDTIKAIESGKREIKVPEFDALCKAYGCTRDDIFLPYEIAKSDISEQKVLQEA